MEISTLEALGSGGERVRPSQEEGMSTTPKCSKMCTNGHKMVQSTMFFFLLCLNAAFAVTVRERLGENKSVTYYEKTPGEPAASL